MPNTMFSRTMTTMISNYVRDYLRVEPSIYKFFDDNNMIRKIPAGQDRWRYFDRKSPGNSKITGVGMQDATILSPNYGETDVHLVNFEGKIRISKKDLDKFRSGTFVQGDLFANTVADAVRNQRNQVDQFIAWGDSMADPGSSIDALRGQDVYTGILNGGTTLAAGDDNDNDMQDNGDFVSTLANYYEALHKAGHQANEYVLISTTDTRKSAFQGNHYLSSTGSTEYARVLNDYPWLVQWISTSNCNEYTDAIDRIAMFQPKQKVRDGVVNTMELIMGYQFEVTPVANGGLTEAGNYEAFLETSCALVEYWETANQRSGNLTV